jgi:hypothetical protein
MASLRITRGLAFCGGSRRCAYMGLGGNTALTFFVIEIVRWADKFFFGEKYMGLLSYGIIRGFEITEIDEENNHKVLHLSIQTDFCTMKYRISTDIRAPDLNVIKNDIHGALLKAKNNEGVNFTMGEFAERYYLFIKDANDITKQYTGNRILV